MDWEDARDIGRIRYLIGDRDAKYPELIDTLIASVGITTVVTESGCRG
jgi:hypothetical protein